MIKSARLAGFFVVILAIAACGASPAATVRPGATATPASAQSGPPEPTATAGAVPTAAPPAGGLDACGIITPAEIQAVVGSVVTAESGGPPDEGSSFCTFNTADGEGLLYTAYDTDGTLGFQAWQGSSDTQPVPGLGDAAIYNPQIGLMVLRGAATYQFYPLADLSDEESLTLATQLATAIASRL